MLREAGLSPEVNAEIRAWVEEYTAGQVAMLESANDGWQRRCAELEAELRQSRNGKDL